MQSIHCAKDWKWSCNQDTCRKFYGKKIENLKKKIIFVNATNLKTYKFPFGLIGDVNR